MCFYGGNQNHFVIAIESKIYHSSNFIMHIFFLQIPINNGISNCLCFNFKCAISSKPFYYCMILFIGMSTFTLRVTKTNYSIGLEKWFYLPK